MKPYYDKDGITIYHGDCREILAWIPSVDVVLTDPPYNVGKEYGQHNDSMEEDDFIKWMKPILSRCGDLSSDSVVFFPGTKHLMRAPSLLEKPLRIYRVLGWHKKEFAGDMWSGGPAMCWEPVVWASKGEKPTFNKFFGTRGRDFLIVPSTHGNPYREVHPCPKPLMVMQWLTSLFAPEGGVVLDPFMGSGTTLQAAKELGRRAIGIEIEEKYCELAVRRLAQEVLPFA